MSDNSKKDKPEYIYLLASDDYPNLVKIGQSKDPQQREKKLMVAQKILKIFVCVIIKK